jgi:hypothetical protein
MKGQALVFLLFLFAIAVGVTLFFGLIKNIQASFKAAPRLPTTVLSDETRRDQRDRMDDIQRRQKDLMRDQKQRMEDMKRMTQR